MIAGMTGTGRSRGSGCEGGSWRIGVCWVALGLVGVAVGWRWLAPDGWPNFSPLMAVALLAPWLAGGRWATAVVLLVVLVLGDLVWLGGGAGGRDWWLAGGVTYLTVLVVGLWGARLGGWGGGRRAGGWGMWGRLLGCSVAFYVLGNTVSWLLWPGYEKGLAGWWQSNTVGLPGYPPSWVFLRHALLSDALFGGVLVAISQPWPVRWERRAEAGMGGEGAGEEA
jgi:hypothetical protein